MTTTVNHEQDCADAERGAIPYPLPEPWRSRLRQRGMRVLDCVQIYGDRAPETIDARVHRDLLLVEFRDAVSRFAPGVEVQGSPKTMDRPVWLSSTTGETT